MARYQPRAIRPTGLDATSRVCRRGRAQARGQLRTSATGRRHCSWNAGPFGPVAGVGLGLAAGHSEIPVLPPSACERHPRRARRRDAHQARPHDPAPTRVVDRGLPVLADHRDEERVDDARVEGMRSRRRVVRVRPECDVCERVRSLLRRLRPVTTDALAVLGVADEERPAGRVDEHRDGLPVALVHLPELTGRDRRAVDVPRVPDPVLELGPASSTQCRAVDDGPTTMRGLGRGVAGRRGWPVDRRARPLVETEVGAAGRDRARGRLPSRRRPVLEVRVGEEAVDGSGRELLRRVEHEDRDVAVEQGSRRRRGRRAGARSGGEGRA